jgi:ketosteroid isomerase-like protein
MNPNEQLITDFYKAFQRRDFKTMQLAYGDDATFSDPVFSGLSATEVRGMWEMLITSATDLKIEFSEVTANDQSGSCLWQARYTFTMTGKPVHNIIRAKFEFRDGKIYKHLDRFDFWRWSKMALGISGLLLGWTPLIKNKVQKTARKRLDKFLVR